MKQFRPASVAVAGLLALALSACSGTTPEPSESPSPTSAAPASSAPASPTPKPATSTSPAENLEPPEMPELATEFSYSGYEAFVEYWFEAHNYALATGDTDLMMEVSDSECGYCLRQKQGIDEVYESGAWVVGVSPHPSVFRSTLDEFDLDSYHALFTVSQEDGRVYSAEGEVLEEYPFTEGEFEFEMFAYHDEGTGWTAGYLGKLQDEE